MINEEAQIIIGNIPINPEALDDCYSIAEYQEAKAMAIEALGQQPSKDTVSIGVFEQVKWERDTAIEQLNQLGYSLGEKMKTDGDCISRSYIESIVEELENICINGDEHILSLLSDIKNAPSVTPQKSKERWIHWTDDYKDYCTCSKCGYGEEGELLLKNITPFCPYCGSYNGGGEE